jgi:hypothetical protein
MASLNSSVGQDVRSDFSPQPTATPVLQNIINEQKRLAAQTEEALIDLVSCAVRLSSDFDTLVPRAKDLPSKEPEALTELEDFFKITEKIARLNNVLQEFVSIFKQIV